MTKILVADDLGEDGMAQLRSSGDVTLRPGMDEDTLRQTLTISRGSYMIFLERPVALTLGLITIGLMGLLVLMNRIQRNTVASATKKVVEDVDEDVEPG